MSVEKGAGMQRNCVTTNSICESVEWFSAVLDLRPQILLCCMRGSLLSERVDIHSSIRRHYLQIHSKTDEQWFKGFTLIKRYMFDYGCCVSVLQKM